MSRRLAIAVFNDEHRFLGAAQAMRQARFDVVQAFTPYPVHGLDEILGLRRSRLPWVTLAAGVAGASLGLAFQYWSTAVDWPLNVGGKPWNSLPAFLVVTFELTILFAGVATFVFVLARSGLFPGKSGGEVVPGTTDDRFALVAGRRPSSPDWDDLREIAESYGAESYAEEDR